MLDSVTDVKKTNLAYTMSVTTNFQYMLTHKSEIPFPVFTQLNYPCMGLKMHSQGCAETASLVKARW